MLQRRKNGFTLIQLLVGISVIVILAVILLPSLRDTGGGAKRTFCANNLREIYMALITYSADHDGWVPGAAPVIEVVELSTWTMFLFTNGYLEGKTYVDVWGVKMNCPSNETGNPYAMNYYSFMGDGRPDCPTVHFRKIETITNPIARCWLSEATDNGMDYVVFAPDDLPEITFEFGRHNGVNVCYVDGHVGFIPKDRLPIKSNSKFWGSSKN